MSLSTCVKTLSGNYEQVLMPRSPAPYQLSQQGGGGADPIKNKNIWPYLFDRAPPGPFLVWYKPEICIPGL